LTPQTAAGRIALKAARQGCAVLAAHTNVDRAVDGTSHPAADVLGLIDRRPITPAEPDAEPGSETEAATPPGDGPSKGMGLIGTLPEPLTITEVARRLADGLPCPTLRLATHDPTRTIRTVGIAGGAGDSMIPALLPHDGQPLVDVFVTGDLKHHPTLDALTMGLSLIDAGHFGTENPAMDAVVDNLRSLKDSYGLRAPIHRSQVNTDPWIDYRHPPSKESTT
jgi:putative NIF3 family GTP cyclohydrolase 1 type 2